MKTLIKTTYNVANNITGIFETVSTLEEAKKARREEAENNFSKDYSCRRALQMACSNEIICTECKDGWMNSCDCNCSCSDEQRIENFESCLTIIKIETFKDEGGEETTEETEI